jgi:hypothetical protein
MKKITFVLVCLFLLSFGLYAEDAEPSSIDKEKTISESNNTGFPPIKERPFIVFNEGVTASWLTRIMRNEERSNFVFTDFMTGAYFGIQTVNMQPLNSIVRVAVFYPLAFTFNDVPQTPKNIIRYAIDTFAGIDIELNMWNYVRINMAPGLHFLFQNADRWNYINLGVGALVGLELPLAKHWTILLNGIASLDNGNLGTNREMEPFDIVYQYQLDVGVRYSKRNPNKFSYIR